MMLATDPPAVVATAPVDKPADVVVVSRDSRSEVLASADTPLPLAKAGKTEDAVLRQAIFVTSTLTVVRPAAGGGQDVLRWTYQAYLQRQLCFTSITGLFSCAATEVDELADKAAGEAPHSETPGQAEAAAEGVSISLTAALRGQAPALFEEDRRLKLSPMLKASGVSVRRTAAAPARSAATPRSALGAARGGETR